MDRPVVTLLVVVAVTVAGCTVTVQRPEPGETASPIDTPPDGTEFEVTVREVIDGDTVAVAFADGSVENVRLLGVDAPEVRSDNDPGEFEGIPDTAAGRDHLRTWGERASAFAASRLEVGETVRITVDGTADRRGNYGRLLVYLYDDGELFNRLLLEGGYARLYDTAFGKRSAFADAETTAQDDGVGLWGYGESASIGPPAVAGARPDQIPNVARSMSRVPGPRPTAMMAIRRMIA